MTNKKENFGNYIINNKEELLRKKKRKIVIKRTFIFLVLLIVISVTLCLTLPVFNLQNVLVTGNSKVSEEEILTLSAIQEGTNVFKINTKNVAIQVKENPYIEKVKVKRKYPNSINIEVEERVRAFYIKTENSYYIIDDKGYVLSQETELEEPFLIELTTIDEANLVVGKQIQGYDENGLNSLAYIFEFLRINNLFDRYTIPKIEINNFVSLNLYINETYLKIGTMDDLYNKLSRGFNILNNDDVKAMKGYIDVSFDGNPVIYKAE